MTVSVFYPDAHPETTSVDGFCFLTGQDSTLATIRGVATGSAVSDGTLIFAGIKASGTSNQFAELYRCYFLFDSSALPDTDEISSAVVNLKRSTNATLNALGDTEMDIVASTPAANTDLISNDYAAVGSTVFASVNTSTITAEAYYDWTLNASGIAAVSKTGVSKFALRIDWDTDNSFTGSWSSGAYTGIYPTAAETNSGTTSDPKLTVTHAAAATFVPRAVVVS